MGEHFWLGMAIIFLGGLLNGSFPLPMKFTRRWEWENTWLIFAVVSAGVMPWVLAGVFVPNLIRVYEGVHRNALLLVLGCGLLWGTGQTMLGLAIKLAGMAFAFAVMSGVACLSGSLIPILVLNPGDLFRPRGLMLIVSIPILLSGLYFYAKAGQRRDSEQRGAASGMGDIGKRLAAGLALSVVTGVFGSSFNLGFAFAGEIVERSLRCGATSLTSTYAVWAVVLGAGFLPNLLYCGYLLLRRRSLALYFHPGSLRNVLLGVAMAFLWLTAIYGFGIGATFVGPYGTSLGFALFIAASILSANLIGIFTGEWHSASRSTMKLLAAGMVTIVISAVVLNLGGLL